MHIRLLATVYVRTIHQGLGSENLIQSTSKHEGMPSPLHCCTGNFYLPLCSFTEQINKLAVAFCHKVLVPFPAEWQATPPAGSRAA